MRATWVIASCCLLLCSCVIEPLDPANKRCSATAVCPAPFICLIAPRASVGACTLVGTPPPAFSVQEDVELTKSVRVNGAGLGVQNSTLGTQTSYLKFQLSGVAPRQVLSAVLRLRNADTLDHATSIELYLGNHSNWTELDITSASAPTSSQRLDRYEGVVRASALLELNATDGISSEGVITLILSAPVGAFQGIEFKSRETGDPAQLILTLSAN